MFKKISGFVGCAGLALASQAHAEGLDTALAVTVDSTTMYAAMAAVLAVVIGIFTYRKVKSLL